jgi:integral membrane sensor domain MASE1
MLFDARHDALPSYAMRALSGAALLGGLAAFFLFIAAGQAPLATKALFAIVAAIQGAALGTISAAKDRNETNLRVALAYAIVGVVFGPLILGAGVVVVELVTWLLGMPALLFKDVGWQWWIGAMVLASGLQAASTLSEVAKQETSKTSPRYVLTAFFGQTLDTFAIVLVAWMCFEPEFPTPQRWLLAALAIGAGCTLMEIASRIIRSRFRRTAAPARN